MATLSSRVVICHLCDSVEMSSPLKSISSVDLSPSTHVSRSVHVRATGGRSRANVQQAEQQKQQKQQKLKPTASVFGGGRQLRKGLSISSKEPQQQLRQLHYCASSIFEKERRQDSGEEQQDRLRCRGAAMEGGATGPSSEEADAIATAIVDVGTEVEVGEKATTNGAGATTATSLLDDDDDDDGDGDIGSLVASLSDETAESVVAAKTESYTTTMQNRMGGDLTYRHEHGMNYARVLPYLIVGSCPQVPGDAEHLKVSEDVRTILCLQEDTDLAYFDVDLKVIQDRAAQIGVEHVRSEIRDFDPFDLRGKLPQAVAGLHNGIVQNGGTAYVHCTAGLGRAPGVALAYMHWIGGYALEEANEILQSVRRCHPKIDSIREATADLLTDNSLAEVVLCWRKGGSCRTVEIAGLDVGWHNRVPLEYNRKEGRWLLRRNLPVGRYMYKYIVDGRWTYNPDAPLTKPDKSGNINNYIEVVGDTLGSEKWAIRQRIVRPGAQLTEQERAKILQKIEELAGMITHPEAAET